MRYSRAIAGQAFLAVGDLMHASLRLKLVDCAAHVPARELLHDGPEGRVPLTHNRVEPCRFHSGLLQLLIGPAGIHALMLAHVADEEHARQLEDRLAAGGAWHDSGFVFTSPIGTALEPRNVTRQFHVVLAAADLTSVRFHDLRHTAATLLLAQGVDPRTIMEHSATRRYR